MTNLADLIRNRRSERGGYDPDRRPPDADIRAILEASQWAPTAHNMQNFEVIVLDDPAVLAEIGRVPGGVSAEFIRENYAQLSFSEDELIAKGTGLPATMFPPEWRQPETPSDDQPAADLIEHGFLDQTMRSCPLVLIVVYDTRKRAPASEGDVLGLISLGCVLENMWLTATSRGIGLQVMSVFSDTGIETRLHEILTIPDHMKIAYACRLGYPATQPARYLRVRRPLEHFVHRNTYTRHLAPTR
ncbi:nitroreductase family protein [Actinospica sp. MGRD01-02]|uniref:Nitroreductase family protein n=1 Tax=Actinospica acidithermotolerans TaxID=2828514 RepID=A0A941EAY2_9ACTN|nr:nitroreductase family protein [Actinospica acidithermotolerans]MBR7826945.1 nitroreductase family protein [Actinospica acidithermotolerans]